MSKIVNCDLCTAEMTLVSTTPTKKSYKVRRYKCPICNYEKSEFGTGCYDKDKDDSPFSLLDDKDVNKMYRQQERNNERD